MQNRRASREFAMQFLFQGEFQNTQNIKSDLSIFKNNFDISKGIVEYSEDIINGVVEHKTDIDGLIEKNSLNWKIHRISHIDRNILRVALFEMVFSKNPVPLKAIINEAIEIAKKYGNTESSSFVNGILDQIAKRKD